MVRVASVDAASAPRSSLVPHHNNHHRGRGGGSIGGGLNVSYGSIYQPGLVNEPPIIYGGSRPLKASIYRHCVRSSIIGGSGGSPGSTFGRHASFVGSRSSNLDSDQEVLTGGATVGGGGTPVQYSYASYGRSSAAAAGQTAAAAYAGSSAGSHRSSGASLQLCRCGSGGPLLPSASNSPPAGMQPQSQPSQQQPPPLPLPPPSLPPPLSTSTMPTSAYSRLVQSLPSTPNASRRPVSPMRPSFCHQLPQQQQHHHQPPHHHHFMESSNLSSQPGSGPIPGMHLKHPHLQQQQAQLYGPFGSASGANCIAIGASTSSGGTPGAPLISANDSPASFRPESRVGDHGAVPGGGGVGGRQKGLRALQHWTRNQRMRNHARHRNGPGGGDGVGGPFDNRASMAHHGGSTQSLMKLSTLVIVLLAVLIIGFIVLSPLFHYLM